MAWNGATRRRGSDGAAEKEAAALRLSSDMAEWECSTTTSSLSLSLPLLCLSLVHHPWKYDMEAI
jgi:hypothetical protein